VKFHLLWIFSILLLKHTSRSLSFSLATNTGYQGAASLVKDDFLLKARKGTSQSRKKAHGKERE